MIRYHWSDSIEFDDLSFYSYYCPICDGCYDDDDDEADDIYLTRKSQNQKQTKKKLVKNKAAHLGMAHLKTEHNIVKTIHYREDSGFAESFQDNRSHRENDLEPFVVYTLNKKKRWGWESNRILCSSPSSNVLILKRVNLKTFEWKFCPWARTPDDFLINAIEYCKHDDESENQMTTIQLDSIFGQTFSHFLPKIAPTLKKSEPIVSYNFIKAPKNFMVLGEQFFVDSNYGKRRYPFYAYQKRMETMKQFHFEIKNLKDLGKSNDPDLADDESDDTNSNMEQNEYQKFYNLEDHVLMDFVFVKRRVGKRNI